jgi:hypothetical protein
MRKWSDLLAATAPLAMMTALLVPAQGNAAPRIRVPETVPATNETPNKPIRVRIPKPIETAGPATAEPSSAEPVKVEQAEIKQPPRIRVNKPPIDTSSPAEVELPPKIRTRVIKPAGDITEVEKKPRIPPKVAVPADDNAGGEPATAKPKRIGRPDLGNVPAKVPVGPIRSVDSAQADCLHRPNMYDREAAKSPSSESVNILYMVCRVNGEAKRMSFSYDIPAEYYSEPANKRPLLANAAAASHFDAGLMSKIGYEIEQLQTDSEGNPVYRLLTITAGENSGTNVSCIDPAASLNIFSLSDGDRGTDMQRWCTDGKVTKPMQFQVNGWLRPWRAKKQSPSIKMYDEKDARKFNNLYAVRFHETMGIGANKSALIEASSPQLDTGMWDCTLDSNQIGSLYCSTDPVKGVVTTYLAYSLPEVRQQIPEFWTPKCVTVVKPVWDETSWSNGDGWGGSLNKFIRYYDYKTVTCDVPRIAYRIIKSPVPSQYRGEIKGACFLANVAGLKSQKVVTITYSRAVEATNTGNTLFEPNLSDPDNSPTKAEIIEGKTISTNGSIDPNTRVNSKGERVPLENITKVNAACN